jgi:hypothetical protein
MKNYLPIALALAMIAGCGNKTEPKTAAPAPPIATKDAQATFVPVPPAQPNAVNDGVQHPAPGEANDDSNPEFKNGGKPVPQKR